MSVLLKILCDPKYSQYADISWISVHNEDERLMTPSMFEVISVKGELCKIVTVKCLECPGVFGTSILKLDFDKTDS